MIGIRAYAGGASSYSLFSEATSASFHNKLLMLSSLIPQAEYDCTPCEQQCEGKQKRIVLHMIGPEAAYLTHYKGLHPGPSFIFAILIPFTRFLRHLHHSKSAALHLIWLNAIFSRNDLYILDDQLNGPFLLSQS
jgi:hypothetical protein